MFVRIGDVRQQHSRSRSSLIDLHQTLAARVGRVTGRPSQVDLCQTSDLEVALGAPSVRRDFLEFLKTQRSTENLMFWDEVQRYKKIRDGSDKQITEAIMIYQKYISDDSKFQVNIADETRRSIGGDPRRPFRSYVSRDMFEQAEKEVLVNMKFHSYPEFRTKRAMSIGAGAGAGADSTPSSSSSSSSSSPSPSPCYDTPSLSSVSLLRDRHRLSPGRATR
eukprot:TRINITY_DN5024_c0_g1_i1.p1 TRINITY_DN5024_c0_g1~~TRINITY_DN5024_c0_g1_i1.p1  ORF type:complete len:221 (-),score=52.65 TRINITY_DN5024_c0_g1_i1:158-820(-)